MENIGNSGVSGNRITSKYTYLGNSLEFRVVLELCEWILTLGSLAIFYPAYPQPGINLPDGWENDKQR